MKWHQNTKSSLFCLVFLAAEILELHKKIRPLEAEISYLKEANAENLEGKEQNVAITL